MAWRGLHISRPARLSYGRGRVMIAQEADGDAGPPDPVSLPLEDLAWIVLDTPRVTLSSALLSACMDVGVPLICADGKHTPNGMLLPFHQHFAQAAVAARQVAAGAPLKKRLWQAIVRRKIENQGAVLDALQLAGGRDMRLMAGQVKSGDPGNVEARAARFYWGRLFLDFRRQDDADLRNAMLNYAYAILRAAVARGLVAAGLLPAFGLHHASAANAFNLADDLLEVLRPAADRLVYGLTDQGRPQAAGAESAGEGSESEGAAAGLTREHRQALLAVITAPFLFDGEQLTLLPAIDRTVASLVRALSGDGAGALALPRV